MRSSGGRIVGAKRGRDSAFGLAIAAIAAAALLLSCATSAEAAPTWLSPSEPSGSSLSSGDGVVAANSAGEAVTAWQTEIGGSERIQVAVKPASESWQSAVTVSQAGRNSYHPQIALDSDGEAIAVWELYNGSRWVAEASVKPPSGSWQTPVALSESSVEATSPTIVFGPGSEAIVAWVAKNGSNTFMQATSRAEAGAAWQAPVAISGNGPNGYEPHLAVNAYGEAIAVWSLYLGGYDGIQAAARSGEGVWQAPVDLSPSGHYAEQPHVALNDEGEAVASWSIESAGKELVQSSTSDDGGESWTSPLTLAESEPYFGPSTQQRAAIDPSGDAIVAFSVGHGGSNSESVGAAVRPGGGAWQSPVTLSGGSSNNGSKGPDVGFGENGEALAVWTHFNGSHGTAESSSLATATGSWSSPQTISDSGEFAYGSDLAIEPRGNAVAVWDMYSGGREHVQSATYVGAGPQLSEVSIPATGEAGESLSFSVSPLDPWSSLGATEWSFGDGEHEEGTSVTHAYASPGHYEVEVKSADVFGNATSQTASVIVQGPPQEETPQEEEAPQNGSPHEEAPTHTPQRPPQQEASSSSAATATIAGTIVAPPDGGPPATQPTPPPLLLLNKAPQPLINANELVLRVACEKSPCLTRASGWVRLPGQDRRIWELTGSRAASAGATTSSVTLSVPRRLRDAVRGYLVHHPRYRVELHLLVTLAAGDQPAQSVEATLPIRTLPGFR